MHRSSRRQFLTRTTQAAAVALTIKPAWGRPAADSAALAGKAVAFLRSRQQADGPWSPDRDEPGITGLVVTGLLRSKLVTPDEPVVAKGLAYLEGMVGDEGGLGKIRHSSYATCVALMAFHDANHNGRYDAAIKGSQRFLRATQFDESNGTARDNPFYGGAGYGPTPTAAPAPAAKAGHEKGDGTDCH